MHRARVLAGLLCRRGLSRLEIPLRVRLELRPAVGVAEAVEVAVVQGGAALRLREIDLHAADRVAPGLGRCHLGEGCAFVGQRLHAFLQSRNVLTLRREISYSAVLFGHPQSRQPWRAHAPQTSLSLSRSAARARCRRTAALLGVMPSSPATSGTLAPSRSTRRRRRACAGLSVSASAETQWQTAAFSARSSSAG